MRIGVFSSSSTGTIIIQLADVFPIYCVKASSQLLHQNTLQAELRTTNTEDTFLLNKILIIFNTINSVPLESLALLMRSSTVGLILKKLSMMQDSSRKEGMDSTW